MSKLSKHAYQELIDGNIAWLEKQPQTLERDHTLGVLRVSVDLLYPEIQRPDLETLAPFTPDELHTVAVNTLLPVDGHKNQAVFDVVSALEKPDGYRPPALATGPAAQGGGVERRVKERRETATYGKFGYSLHLPAKEQRTGTDRRAGAKEVLGEGAPPSAHQSLEIKPNEGRHREGNTIVDQEGAGSERAARGNELRSSGAESGARIRNDERGEVAEKAGHLSPPAAAQGVEQYIEALRKIKLRLHFMGWPAESYWNAGSEHEPHWIPDWRYECQLIDHLLDGAPITTPEKPTDSVPRNQLPLLTIRAVIEPRLNALPLPARQQEGEGS